MSVTTSPLRWLIFPALLLVSGCSTLWSPEERAKLAQVQLVPTTVAAGAYQVPSAKESPNMAQGIPQATGGGLIPALIGAAIDKTVTTRQQNKFEATNAVHFEPLKNAFGAALNGEIDAALRAALEKHAFFGPRLSAQAPAQLTIKLLDYGLTKSPASQGDDVLLRVHLTTEVKLAHGETTLYSGRLEGVGYKGARAAEILAQPDFIPTGRRQAAEDLATRLVEQLNLRLEDPRKRR